MRYLLAISLSLLLGYSLLLGQSERTQSIIIPASVVGEISDSRKQNLQNILKQELPKHFDVSGKSEEVSDLRNVLQLHIVEKQGDLQLSLKWISLEEKKKKKNSAKTVIRKS